MVNLKWGIRRRMEVMTISLSSSLSTSNLKWHIRRRMEAWLASYAAGAIAGTFYNPIIEEQFIKATIHSFDRLICHCANIDKKEEIWNDRGYMGCETFFFYKFKHLFSFKILYRRLWGQIHKISLDTIVEIHLLLFPLLRLLCKYWLILYYCIATRQDRTFAASWTFGLPDWQCLPWEALDSVGTWNGQWVEFRTKAGTQIFWTHHNKTLIKKKLMMGWGVKIAMLPLVCVRVAPQLLAKMGKKLQFGKFW